MQLSVIIPVYNTQDYLSCCLDSVLEQRIKDMEIICVDDGSTDGSGKVLDQYAALDSRIKVIHQDNKGLVRARKSGIQIAKGEYSAYVDSDDWIEPDMYETLCSVAEQYHVDLVSCGYILEKGMRTEFCDGFPEGLYRDEELGILQEQVFFREDSGKPGIRPCLWNKLFRTSILKKVQMSIPDEVSNGEDRICTVAYMLEAESVYIMERAFYHYVFHQNSMSRREDAHYLDKLGRVYRSLRSLYQHPKFSERMRLQCELYIVSRMLEGLNAYMGFSVPDLMWLNPKWMESIPEKASIVLYGAGRLGKACYRQIVSDYKKGLRLLAWVDRNYMNLTGYPRDIDSPEFIRNAEYDFVLIALVERQHAQEAQKQLVKEYGVDEEKIIWVEQKDIFWEYAEVAGLLERKPEQWN